MPNLSNIRGFVPKRHRNASSFKAPLRRYFVPATDANALFEGSPVVLAGDGDARGTPSCTRAAPGGRITGIVCGIANDPSLPASNEMMRLGYRPGGQAGYVLVMDDPEVLLEIEEDGVGGTLTAANIGQNIDFVIGNGSTFTRQSGAMLDSSTAAVTAGLPLRIVQLEQRPDNEIGPNAKWLVAINQPTETGAAGSTGI